MRYIAITLLSISAVAAAPFFEPGPGATAPVAELVSGSGGTTSEQALDMTFGPAITLPRSGNFSEPTVMVGFDGTIVLAAPGARTATWRSLDGGATFERAASTTGLAGDSDIAIDGVGRIYVSDLSPNVPVAVSEDALASYARTAETAFDAENDRQWLAAYGDGHVYSAWLVQWPGTDAGDRAIFLAASHDAGTNYALHEVVLQGVRYMGKLRATAEDSVWIPYITGAREAKVAWSTDGGATWTHSLVARLPGNSLIFPSIAFDGAGTAYYVWSQSTSLADTFDLSSDVFLSWSVDGLAWAPPTLLSSGDRYDIFPWAVAGAPGRVAVVWYEGEAPAGLLFDPTYAPMTSWRVAVAFSSAADTPGAPWSRTLATDVFHTGPACTLGGQCATVRNPFALDRRLLDYVEAAALPDGRLIFAHPYDVDVNGATLLAARIQSTGPDLQD